MGYWSIIQPQATTNLCTNPSLETAATGWTPALNNTAARSTEQSKYGVYSYKVTYVDNANLCSFTPSLTASETYALSAWIYVPANWDGGNLFLTQLNYTSSTLTTVTTWETSDDTGIWYYIESQLELGADNTGSIVLATSDAPTAGRYVYIDGLQIELSRDPATTYCDGDQTGCAWTGTRHASASTRGALEPSGGVLLNFADDLDFHISDQDGTGMPPVENISSALALQPGALFERQKMLSRLIRLRGSIIGDSVTDYHNKKRTLLAALNPATVAIGNTGKERTLRYTGATVNKEITAVYDGGLEGGLRLGFSQVDVELRLKAHDPLFYQIGNTGKVLDSTDSATASYVMRRTAGGLWDVMGPPSSGGEVFALAEDDNYIYVGGNFTNWDGTAASDYIARYSKAAGTWSALGSGMNGVVRALAVAPNGDLYAGGDFTTAGGGAANRIAKWDGSAWSALDVGLGIGNCYALAMSPGGVLYVGGGFTLAGGGGANYIATWNGTAWAALGTGLNAICYTIAIAPDGSVYAGGNFTTAGGSTVNYIAKWNGTAWSALETGLSGGACRAIVTAVDGSVYAGGEFSGASGRDADFVAVWNGNAWANLTNGPDDACFALALASDGTLYAGGEFAEVASTESGVTVTGVAVWNGSAWGFVDVKLPGTVTVNDILIARDGALYLAFNTTGTATYSGDSTITYTGTERAYPVIYISRSGGTSAQLLSIRNETTGATLYFNYSLGNGELLTVDCRPGKQSIRSSFSGDVYSELLPASDFGDFYLLPGNSGEQDNLITCFVSEAGSPTVTVHAVWRSAYISED